MASKRFNGRTCAYCGAGSLNVTADHVIARSFFLKEDRDNLPQVPSCSFCNSKKSKLETYASAALMVGSLHPEAQRYRQELVKPRLDKNAKLRRELGLDGNRIPEWRSVNGVLQPMFAVKINAGKVTQLMEMIVKGLFCFHTGEGLSKDWEPDVAMYHPDREVSMWEEFRPLFPAESATWQGDLGRSSFSYSAIRSSGEQSFTLWQLSWHGGIPLHGEGSPDNGINRWWAVTRPTQAAVEMARQTGG